MVTIIIIEDICLSLSIYIYIQIMCYNNAYVPIRTCISEPIAQQLSQAQKNSHLTLVHLGLRAVTLKPQA